jgi:hypothetical protein
MSDNDNDHKLIAWLKDYSGDIEDGQIQQQFLHMNDAERTAALQALSGQLDEGSLRQKSQLAKMGRELNHLHLKMRKVGR